MCSAREPRAGFVESTTTWLVPCVSTHRASRGCAPSAYPSKLSQNANVQGSEGPPSTTELSDQPVSRTPTSLIASASAPGPTSDIVASMEGTPSPPSIEAPPLGVAEPAAPDGPAPPTSPVPEAPPCPPPAPCRRPESTEASGAHAEADRRKGQDAARMTGSTRRPPARNGFMDASSLRDLG